MKGLLKLAGPGLAGAIAFGLLVADGAYTSAAAQSYRYMTCGELWYARNEIYARNGYCFKTARARRVFGRACFPPYGKLSRWETEEVQKIKQWERRKGC